MYSTASSFAHGAKLSFLLTVATMAKIESVYGYKFLIHGATPKPYGRVLLATGVGVRVAIGRGTGEFEQ